MAEVLEREPAAHRRWRRPAISGTVGVGALGLGAWALSGHTAELSGAVDQLQNLRVGWVIVAVIAEATSYVAYAAVERVLLKSGGLVASLRSLTAISLAGNAIQNSLPGGPAWAGVYAFRQFRRLGADSVLAGWSMVAVALVVDIALAFIAAAGLIVAGGQASAFSLALPLGAALVVLAATAYVLMQRGHFTEHRAIAVIRVAIRAHARLGRRPRSSVDERALAIWNRIRAVTPSGGAWLRSLGLAAANWVGDIVCLLAAIGAVGAHVPWRGVLLAYGAGQLAANLPVTPGGLGVVEGSIAVALVAFGANEERMVAAVLLYRILSFWALLVVGWSTWGVLAFRGRTLDAEASG